MRWLGLLVCGAALAEEPSAWQSLFDGMTPAGWRAAVTDRFPDECWRIEGGAFRPLPGYVNKDLWTVEQFRNFEFEFAFELEPGANGGIKYLIQRGAAGRMRGDNWFSARDSKPEAGDVFVEASVGVEYQIVDDAAREARNPKRRTAALYGLVAPVDPPPVGPGTTHRGRIVVRRSHLEHYLNGKRVLAIDLDSPEMAAAWEACERRDIQSMRPLPKREGPIAITHHGSTVRYRDLRVRRLPD